MSQTLSHDVETGDLFDGPMLTPHEVARRLEVDTETLRRWARADTGPPFVLAAPSTRRYPERGLVAWMRSNLRPQPEARAS